MRPQQHAPGGEPVVSTREPVRHPWRQATIALRRLAGLMAGSCWRPIKRVLRRPGARLLTGLAAVLHSSALALDMQAPREGPGTGGRTSAAINADPSLTRRQRRMLIDIYESFQKKNQDKAAPAKNAAVGRLDAHAVPDERTGWPMNFTDKVKKIAESKPFCAVAGAGGYAVDQLRRMRSRDVPRTARTLPGRTAETITQELPVKARSYADTAAARVTKVYDDLAIRGRQIVSSVSGRAAHEFEDVSQAAQPKAPRAKVPARRPEPVVTPSPARAPARKKQQSVVQPSPAEAPVRDTTSTGPSTTPGKPTRQSTRKSTRKA
ncbi:hypothetical protein [Nonomuraea sp. SYSU D8015]|uniref:hypothetical protein n=1 Tax=Nonomuraea sp. SYSU D8015 TaxID=2593644 RepID=UPI001660C802|nr:hypothetical protein [Nonomuraea sp. SYSU D8015]